MADLTPRQQRAAETISDNERLTADLKDDAAIALLDWARAHAAQVAGDATRSDAQVEEVVQAIARAVRHATKHAATVGDTAALVALAQARLTGGSGRG